MGVSLDDITRTTIGLVREDGDRALSQGTGITEALDVDDVTFLLVYRLDRVGANIRAVPVNCPKLVTSS